MHSDGTWSRPVVVILRNCEDTELPIRVCSVCHIGRHGRENMRGVTLFLVITYGYSVVGPSPHLGWRSDLEVELVIFLSVESVSCFPFWGSIRGFHSLKDRKKVSSDESVTCGFTVFHLDLQPVE